MRGLPDARDLDGSPDADDLALIGDAAGYSDLHIGQGLSIALLL